MVTFERFSCQKAKRVFSPTNIKAVLKAVIKRTPERDKNGSERLVKTFLVLVFDGERFDFFFEWLACEICRFLRLKAIFYLQKMARKRLVNYPTNTDDPTPTLGQG